jgi:cytochrome c biogenesis protein CcmG/thiol:disulfide interchange protein DsbE
VTESVLEEPARRPGKRQRATWLAVIGVLLAVVVMAYVFNGRFGHDPRLVDSPLIGQPFPNLTLSHLEEEGQLDFADLRGEVLVVNLWASWCFPCRAEHPVLTTASSVYDGRGVHFVGILYQDRAAQGIEFLDEFGRGTNYSYVVDADSRATVELGVYGIPETYFVDASGVIRAKVQGEVSAGVLIDTIEALLAGREPEL